VGATLVGATLVVVLVGAPLKRRRQSTSEFPRVRSAPPSELCALPHRGSARYQTVQSCQRGVHVLDLETQACTAQWARRVEAQVDKIAGAAHVRKAIVQFVHADEPEVFPIILTNGEIRARQRDFREVSRTATFQ